jgi:diadenylate cyclase
MDIFNIGFLTIRLLDIVDIILVALLIYLLYKLVRGTIAFNIFLGFLFVYLFWLVVQALNMQLLSTILGQFIGVGVIALLIVFQQEIRRFLLLIGKNSAFFNRPGGWKILLPWNWRLEKPQDLNFTEIVEACKEMSKTKTGALIVIAKTSELRFYASTGTAIDAEISSKLLEAVFNKNSPLHDGAMIIAKNKIKAASCILPVSENDTIPKFLGMRHRSGLGISEQTDAMAIMVSEERGTISVANGGKFMLKVSPKKLHEILQTEFIESTTLR